jgi:hypothetical protein
LHRRLVSDDAPAVHWHLNLFYDVEKHWVQLFLAWLLLEFNLIHFNLVFLNVSNGLVMSNIALTVDALNVVLVTTMAQLVSLLLLFLDRELCWRG